MVKIQTSTTERPKQALEGSWVTGVDGEYGTDSRRH